MSDSFSIDLHNLQQLRQDAMKELLWIRQWIRKAEEGGGVVISGVDGFQLSKWIDRVDALEDPQSITSIDQAVSDERENCAIICKTLEWKLNAVEWISLSKKQISERIAKDLADAIRGKRP